MTDYDDAHCVARQAAGLFAASCRTTGTLFIYPSRETLVIELEERQRMLSEEHRLQVEAEEKARLTARKEFEEMHGGSQKKRPLWEFANSGFGLLLFSSVVVSLGSWAFTSLQSINASAESGREMARKLDMEILTRVENGLAVLEHEFYAPRSSAWFEHVLNAHLGEHHEIGTLTAYPEYKERSLRSLLAERDSLGATPIRDCRTASENLKDVVESLRRMKREGTSHLGARVMRLLDAEDVTAAFREVKKLADDKTARKAFETRWGEPYNEEKLILLLHGKEEIRKVSSKLTEAFREWLGAAPPAASVQITAPKEQHAASPEKKE